MEYTTTGLYDILHKVWGGHHQKVVNLRQFMSPNVKIMYIVRYSALINTHISQSLVPCTLSRKSSKLAVLCECKRVCTISNLISRPCIREGMKLAHQLMTSFIQYNEEELESHITSG